MKIISAMESFNLQIATLDTGKSTIYDENLLDITRGIGTLKIHD